MSALSGARAAGRTGRTLATLRAYVALTKPNIIWLLLITTVPAMVVAADGWPSTWLVFATLLGGILAAGGANTINQFADRDIDARMSRTRHRPLVAGSIAPKRAVVFGLLLGALAAAWLAVTVNWVAAALAIGALAFYVLVYTYYLKRSTVQNIVIGGAAGAAPPLIGWAAVTGGIDAPALLLFLIVFYWTPPHFWALALVLADEYREAGVPMMPVVRGEAETKRQIVLYSWLLVPLTLIFWAVAELGPLYLAVALLGGAGMLAFAQRLRRRSGHRGRDAALPLLALLPHRALHRDGGRPHRARLAARLPGEEAQRDHGAGHAPARDHREVQRLQAGAALERVERGLQRDREVLDREELADQREPRRRVLVERDEDVGDEQ